MSDAQAHATVQRLVGDAPLATQSCGVGRFWFKMKSLASARKLTSFNGRTFKDQPHVLSAKIKEVKLPVTEIFELIQEKLRLRELSGEYSQAARAPGRVVRKAARSESKPPENRSARARTPEPRVCVDENQNVVHHPSGKGLQNHPPQQSQPNQGKGWGPRQNYFTENDGWTNVGKGGKGTPQNFTSPNFKGQSSKGQGFKGGFNGGKGKGSFGGRGKGNGKGWQPHQSVPPSCTTACITPCEK